MEFLSSRLTAALNGEDGTAPTDGENAQTVHVSLKRAKDAHLGSPPAAHLMVTVDRHDDQCVDLQPHSDLKEEFIHDLGSEGNILSHLAEVLEIEVAPEAMDKGVDTGYMVRTLLSEPMEDQAAMVEPRVMELQGPTVEGPAKLNFSSRKRIWIYC